MLEETKDTEEIVERVAALDIGEVVCCTRVPREGRQGDACRKSRPTRP